MPQGRIGKIRGTTLIIFPKRKISSDSSKSYPCNGGNRVPLLKLPLVYRTDSGIRSLNASAPARTTRRLSAASTESEFSVNVFSYVQLSFNHKRVCLSMDTFHISGMGKQVVFVINGKSVFPREKHLTFKGGHVKVWSIRKRL